MNRQESLVAPARSRSPWQRLYEAVHAVRRRWYAGRAAQLPRPVVSVGNLHWGGTGKTPLVAAIAGRLAAHGLHVTILSRGYRSKGSGIRIVSTGDGPILGPRVAGDEPVQLASELPGVSVVVGPDRFQAGIHALERLPSSTDLFLLEDGFSHIRLYRDVDLLTFPEIDPFAGGRLPPAGRLREPLVSSRHADAVILTGADAHTGRELAHSLRPFGFDGPGFSAPSIVGEAVVERGEPLEAGARVLLVTGIAKPERMLHSVLSLPYEIAGTLEFPDHHDYPEESLQRIEAELASNSARYVLTTAKDHVKLLGRIELPLAMVPLRAEPEESFWAWIEDRLERSR
jgi:tetraacyldisaccharide 4'-kinase